MELLWDLVDTELKFGCKLKEGDNYSTVLKILNTWPEEVYSIQIMSSKYTDENIKIETLAWEDWEEIFERFEILWQYWLGTILRRFDKKSTHTIVVDWFSWCLVEIFRTIWEYKYILSNWENVKLDLTKPPMEYTEAQDKELLDFMTKVIEEWEKQS